MQLTAIWTLLLATLAPMIADVQSRVSNDRIVFPGDIAKVNSGLSIATRSDRNGASESTELPAVSDRIVFPEDKEYPKDTDNYNLSSSNSTLPPSNSTSSSVVGAQSESFENTTVVVNRILLETLKVCPKGQSLHQGYCRRKV